MKVYSSGLFNGHEKGERPLKQMRLEHSFTWEKIKGVIPAIYLGEQAVILDICIPFSVEALECFLDKWNLEKRCSDLCAQEREEMERDNPCSLDFRIHMTINGEALRSSHMCSVCWHPLEREDAWRDEDAEAVMSAYHCDPSSGWMFIRSRFEWETSPVSHIQKLELTFEEMKHPVTAAYFVTEENDFKKTVSVQHPITGQVCEIEILGYQAEKMEDSVFQSLRVHMGEDLEYPLFYRSLTYRVSLEAFREEMIIWDCAQGDRPRRKMQNVKSAHAVSVLGGSSGPTAVFAAGKSPDRSKKSVMSALHYIQENQTRWRVVFQVREREDLKITLEPSAVFDSVMPL